MIWGGLRLPLTDGEGGRAFRQKIISATSSMIMRLGNLLKDSVLQIPLTHSFIVRFSHYISPTFSLLELMLILICSSARLPCMHVNCPSIRMLVILKPRCMQTCFTCLIDSCSVDASQLAMCSAVIKLTCLEIVLIKRMPFINMMSPASVMLLYRSKMVVGRCKISPLMCGFFCLVVFPFMHPRSFPQMSSVPLTSS